MPIIINYCTVLHVGQGYVFIDLESMCYAAPTRRLLFTARHPLSFDIPYLVFGGMSMESYEMKMRNPSKGTPPYSFMKRGMGSFMYNVQ